ncbi:MAG: 16S rRNA (cytosine(1402)-N(4))-methyltransferase RsmH [Candidatus Coatesbacteria bacterium]|nr:16S rRNA (cytosine(1402)-N(4))-methyltransferase RsmH [Candidatus Coatesbacteria bacterium]
MKYFHKAVLLKELVEALLWNIDGIYVDGTIGEGGHAEAISSLLSQNAEFIGIDKDDTVIEVARERLKDKKPKISIFSDSYSNLGTILESLHIKKVHGIYLDLGLSQRQIALSEKGFSYQKQGPLDMRYDRKSSITASEIVNNYSAEELTMVFKRGGEVRGARNLVKKIVEERKNKLFEDTMQLSNFIEKYVGFKHALKVKKQVFQALRIETNNELRELGKFLDSIHEYLIPDGRLAIISYHSLEDRLIKIWGRNSTAKCLCPPDALYCSCGTVPKFENLSKSAIKPLPEEVEENSSAHSAHLRVFKKV